MKSVQDAIQEIEEIKTYKGLDSEWSFDFPVDEIEQEPPQDAVDWLVAVLNGHEYADSYVGPFLIELYDRQTDWYAQLEPLLQQTPELGTFLGYDKVG